VIDEEDNNMNHLQDNLSASRIIIPLLFVAIGITTLLWIGTKPESVPVQEVVVCEITMPYLMLRDGWKIMGREDQPNVNALARVGKVEVKPVDSLVSCTHYEDHKTPVTSLYALKMWRAV
jgi:hypothetical protein